MKEGTHMRKILLVTIAAITAFSVFACQSAEQTTTLTENTVDDNLIIPELSYVIVDTNQTLYFNNTDIINEVFEGEAFYGQNANYSNNSSAYQDNGDGTITDLNTGLMWSQTTDINGDGVMDSEDKLSYDNK